MRRSNLPVAGEINVLVVGSCRTQLPRKSSHCHAAIIFFNFVVKRDLRVSKET